MITIRNYTHTVLVFKTNIQNQKDVSRVGLMLSNDHRIQKWNVDKDDVDKVLRIEATDLLPSEVIDLVENMGYFCEELND